jgi:hypothetical protein
MRMRGYKWWNMHTGCNAHARLKMVEHAHRLQCTCAVIKGRIGQRMQGRAHGVIPPTCATAVHSTTKPAMRTRGQKSQYVLYCNFRKNNGHRKQKCQHLLEATKNGFNYNVKKDKEVSDVLILKKGCRVTIFDRNYVPER